MNTFIPKNIEDLLIPFKDDFIRFYDEIQQSNELSILLVGQRETCKTTIIELIIRNFLRLKSRFNEKQIVFRFNAFDEINLQNPHNELHVFCQNNVNSNKIVYIDQLDFFNDSNQQLLKIYMDQYNTLKTRNKVFFILEGLQEEKIRDVIKSRVKVFRTSPLEQSEYRIILSKMLTDVEIKINDDAFNQIIQFSNITISALENLTIKAKLLDLSYIDTCEVAILCDYVNLSEFENYFKLLSCGRKREAIDILLQLYKNGRDIGDIYFNIYEYIKVSKNEKLYPAVKNICEYINEVCNGNYDPIMLTLLTYDVFNSINRKNI